MTFRCPACRTRRKDYDLFTQHLKDSGHRACDCGGYHHRPGSPCCVQHPFAALDEAKRRGDDMGTLMDIFIDTIWENPQPAVEVCPF